MKDNIKNCLTWLANKTAENYVYGYAKGREKDTLDTFYNEFKTKKLIDFENITISEARELRFGKWEDNNDLWLIPIWLYPLIPIGLELKSISGEKVIFNGNNIDKDIRFGCLAYGIELKE